MCIRDSYYTLLCKVNRGYGSTTKGEQRKQDRRSALARRNFCDLRIKKSLRFSAYSLRPLSLGCQRAYPRSCGSAVSLGHPDNSPNVRSNNREPNKKTVTLNCL